MKGNVLETVMGAVVLVVAALFLFFAYNTSQLRAVKGYELTADFERVDGIRDGGDVRVSGIKIGSIVAQTLDPKTFLARLQLSIDPSVKLPDDTVAEIVSAGLLGDKYLSLVPGGSDTLIPAGGRIKYTQSSRAWPAAPPASSIPTIRENPGRAGGDGAGHGRCQRQCGRDDRRAAGADAGARQDHRAGVAVQRAGRPDRAVRQAVGHRARMPAQPARGAAGERRLRRNLRGPAGRGEGTAVQRLDVFLKPGVVGA